MCHLVESKFQWVTSQKKKKVHTQFPACSWLSCTRVTATAACCKVVSQYRKQIVLLLQMPSEHLQLILATEDCVAMQSGRGTFGRTAKYWYGKGAVVEVLQCVMKRRGGSQGLDDPRQDTGQVRNLGWRILFDIYCCMNAALHHVLKHWSYKEMSRASSLLCNHTPSFSKLMRSLWIPVYICLSLCLGNTPHTFLRNTYGLSTKQAALGSRLAVPESSLVCWRSQSKRGEERDFL